MADEETSSVTDAWDMPSLISSVYATPLFRIGLEPINLPGFGDVSENQQAIKSEGFVFPPSEHENLPVEADVDELSSGDIAKEGSYAGNNDDWCYVTPEESAEELSVTGDLPSASETTDPDSKTSEVHAKHKKDHITFNSDLPCEGWWKRKSTYIFHHIKGVTTVCSVVAAGAVVGFLVMGQRFQDNNWHFHQINLSVSSESMGRVIRLFSRLKDGLPGGQQIRTLLPTRLELPQQLNA